MNDDQHTSPQRNAKHDALQIFVGTWLHKGESFANEQQSASNPKGKADFWDGKSINTWITGEYFLVQDEHASIGGNTFHTISVMGLDPKTNSYYVKSFSHLGFYRHYELTQSGNLWTISGEAERARIEFTADGRTQHIVWEWFRGDEWLPLCDRKAVCIE